MAKRFLIRKPDDPKDRGLDFGIKSLIQHTEFDDDEVEQIASLKEGEKLDFDKGTANWFQVTCLSE